MYYFSIPDSGATIEYNKLLLSVMQQHRDWLYDDFAIESAFGCPPSCIWNGNRSLFSGPYRPSFFRKRLEVYQNAGIHYRLIFTNFLLQPEHLYDVYSNMIASMVNEVGGYVMVSIPLMANYMKKYPNLRLCWSTTTDFGDTEGKRIKKINELSATHLVVVPYEFNNKPQLKRFTHPENLEIIVNEDCIDNCPFRRQHWINVNTVNLFKAPVEYTKCLADAKQPGHNPSYFHNVRRQQLDYYTAMGINHFKIVGRISSVQALNAYLEFFVLPDRKDDFLKFYIDKLKGIIDKNDIEV